MVRVFIVHGWSKAPETDWFPWLKSELKKKGFDVRCPRMPNTDAPAIKPWVTRLAKVVGEPESSDIFIGHSVGCQTILRYFQSKRNKFRVHGVLLVAPWMHLKIDKSWEQRDINTARPWIKTPLKWNKVKQRSRKFTAILSDNDPFVPLSDARIFKSRLDAKIIIMHNRGHMDQEAGLKKAPFLLKEVLNIARK